MRLLSVPTAHYPRAVGLGGPRDAPLQFGRRLFAQLHGDTRFDPIGLVLPQQGIDLPQPPVVEKAPVDGIHRNPVHVTLKRNSKAWLFLRVR